MVVVVTTRLLVPAALRLHHEMRRGWIAEKKYAT